MNESMISVSRITTLKFELFSPLRTRLGKSDIGEMIQNKYRTRISKQGDTNENDTVFIAALLCIVNICEGSGVYSTTPDATHLIMPDPEYRRRSGGYRIRKTFYISSFGLTNYLITNLHQLQRLVKLWGLV